MCHSLCETMTNYPAIKITGLHEYLLFCTEIVTHKYSYITPKVPSIMGLDILSFKMVFFPYQDYLSCNFSPIYMPQYLLYSFLIITHLGYSGY